MENEALNEILNLSSTATMALIGVGMIYSLILYVMSSIISIFTRWVYLKLDKLKKERKDNV